MQPPNRYKAIAAFEKDGLAYEAGKTYEFAPDTAFTPEELANLEQIFPVVPTPEPTPTAPIEPPTNSGSGEAPKKEVKPAKEWAGNHRVGQDEPERKRHPDLMPKKK